MPSIVRSTLAMKIHLPSSRVQSPPCAFCGGDKRIATIVFVGQSQSASIARASAELLQQRARWHWCTSPSRFRLQTSRPAIHDKHRCAAPETCPALPAAVATVATTLNPTLSSSNTYRVRTVCTRIPGRLLHSSPPRLCLNPHPHGDVNVCFARETSANLRLADRG